MSLIQHFPRNLRGKDYAVGDIHGHFSLLAAALKDVGFDVTRDRLFSVGDLVDRGPESHLARKWIAEPWFHPVMGNHDHYILKYGQSPTGSWSRGVGQWYTSLSDKKREKHRRAFSTLPVLIEVETVNGLVGIVHGSINHRDWDTVRALTKTKAGINNLTWSRTKIKDLHVHSISGIHAVVCGHYPVPCIVRLGNVYHIDTSGHRPESGGYFTLLDLNKI